MAPRILIFSIAIGAEPSFQLKFIAVPTFFGQIYSLLNGVYGQGRIKSVENIL